ncbi:hypothetical protein E2C01_093922 [Portunus trituberculatus]|uniref:Uncharacterized protein n=1 Tax=Portunus trituberculatus TaxID=210409 RepID=A0A5B7K018_PORTR|nr:hypothetical protein [Portunus trituberculatus]
MSLHSSPPTTPCIEGNSSWRVAATSWNDDFFLFFLFYNYIMGS